ncbi:hypothetical protein BDQ17DRAFT_1436120 [Cyathus striatus]|nr:hypothetical protein BDQ17DRAFT_1436120 [Cyathus striatus]
MSHTISDANDKLPYMRPKESGSFGFTMVAGAEHGIGGFSRPLPPGAMPATLPLSFQTQNQETPPSTPSQRLLEPECAQYAGYTDQKPVTLSYPPGAYPAETQVVYDHAWIPFPLRRRFWVPFIVILIGAALALEVALHFSNKNQGWPTKGNIEDQFNFFHYAYVTLPPVAAAALLVSLWTWTDIEIKKMQPYVDLVHGNSPPHRSLLLDYTRTNNFVVWVRAASNTHYLVTLSSLMVIICLAFQPLAAALLIVKDVYWTEPDLTVTNVNALGFNYALQTIDLTSYLTASGYAGASTLYGIGPPPFVNQSYAIAQFDLPAIRSSVNNGTIFANTSAIKSQAQCQTVTVQMVQHADGLGWTNSMNSNNCSNSWVVDKNSTVLFGTDTPTCDPQVDPIFSPVVFWIFAYDPVRANATFCFPSFSLWDLSSASNFSEYANTLTGPPLNGQALNGIKFNLTNPDQFALARQNATQLQMPAAIYQAGLAPDGNISAVFEKDNFTALANATYGLYLSLIARSVYFIPTPQNGDEITVQIKTFRKRVVLSPTAVHLLTAGLLILAVFGTIIHLFHRQERRELRLRHQPGTIASAVSIGAQTGVGEVLAGRQAEKDISDSLRNKKFRIDPKTMKIIMEGEEGYEVATSPGPAHPSRRWPTSASLQKQEADKSPSFGPGTPKTA